LRKEMGDTVEGTKVSNLVVREVPPERAPM
jgi:hypothetical protein